MQYEVIQERSFFWELTLLVIVREKKSLNVRLCLISSGNRDRAEPSELTRLYFHLWGWIKNKVYKRKVNRRDELLARFWNAAATVKKHKGQLRRTTRHLHTGIIKCIEDDCKIFEHLNHTSHRKNQQDATV
jgi:hypothetical protein